MGKKRHAIIMKMVLFTFLASLWGLTEFSGMAGVCMGNEPDVVLQKQDSGKEITIKAGQGIQIQLEGLGGTGYWWYVENLDARRMELLSEKTKSVSDGRVGGPVLGLWTFRAMEPGTVEIKMDYYRIWEGSAKAIDHFQVRIKVE
ncbi:MAG: protease inhibitor I42 family protein [Thermodesulfobacteriota bacterium]|jgi:predicted secreted protein